MVQRGPKIIHMAHNMTPRGAKIPKVAPRWSQDSQRSRIGVVRFERDIYVTLSDDQQRLGMALDHLRHLGFEGADVVRLHPDHPDFFSLVWKPVQVRCRMKGDSVYWNFAWSGRRPTAIKLEEAESTAKVLKPLIDRMRGDSIDGDLPGSSSSDSRPPVSY